MSTISTLKLWRDPGYTEGCLEVPPFSKSLPTADLTLTDLNPSKDRLFSEVRVTEPYETLYDMCYLQATYNMNNGNDVTFYGWIDAVSCQSDTDGYPITTISWHVDMWRTFGSKAVFGSGMVKRRPVSGDMPPQEYPHRYMLPDTRYWLTSYKNTDVWWAFVRRNVNTSGATSSKWMIWPVNIGNPSATLKIEAGGYDAPSLDELVSGEWDELLALNPEEVSFVGVSPIPPCDYTGSGASNYAITLNPTTNADWTYRAIGQRGCWYVSDADAMEELNITFSLGTKPMTTDTTSFVVTGFDGEPIGTLPWGIEFESIMVRNIPSSNGLAVQVRFIRTNEETDTQYSNVVGGVFSCICPTLELGSNAWSSYVYSGARQAEMMQRQLNSEAQAVQGGISTGTSAVTGALSGAMMGAVAGAAGGPVGMLAGALIGGVGSALASGISTGANYAYQTGTLNDQMQAVSDYAQSHQASVQLLSGSGTDFCVNPYKGMLLVRMSWDDYSQEQRQNDLDLYGCSVSEPTSSCQSLVNAGGPLQIQNLVVTGDIPTQAKTFFRDRFSKGVRIV